MLVGQCLSGRDDEMMRFFRSKNEILRGIRACRFYGGACRPRLGDGGLESIAISLVEMLVHVILWVVFSLVFLAAYNNAIIL